MERFFRATWTPCLRAYKRERERERGGREFINKTPGRLLMRGRWRWLHRNTRGWQQNREQLCFEEGGGQSKSKSITHRVRVCRSFCRRAPFRPSSFSAPRVLDPRACVNHETLVFDDTERMERRRIAFNDARFMLSFRENRSCYGLGAVGEKGWASFRCWFVRDLFIASWDCLGLYFSNRIALRLLMNVNDSFLPWRNWWYPSLLWRMIKNSIVFNFFEIVKWKVSTRVRVNGQFSSEILRG